VFENWDPLDINQRAIVSNTNSLNELQEVVDDDTRLSYKAFAPTKSVQALKKAVYRLYCYEDFTINGKLGNGYFATVWLVTLDPFLNIIVLSAFLGLKIMYGTCIIGGRLACLTEFYVFLLF
ncbi:unnamed protein product, partial [Protopolystoma xenopodis]